ncbi:MAG: ABC transporter permease [Gammaproteobacteria bacterium]|nr:MAG: ABC transporter permease [Gammaproteobacteria bacterium]
MRETIAVCRKELAGFFSSPAAYLFLGSFLLVTLFVFFWVETFFARNLADVRPLFEWMPLLLVFLSAALTMRAWSEEHRAGTLELLESAPVGTLSLVLGKFMAGVAMIALALLLTLPLPVTVSLLGPLDWGPVIGGYLASLFLACAYLAMGLWISARSDNAIVSLILTTLLAGAFYLLGAPTLTALAGQKVGELLQLVSTAGRFQSITRGVLDLRDVCYYLSLTGVFLTLNAYALARLRWQGNPERPSHARRRWLTLLVALNFLAANLWLAPLGTARMDMTADRIYSLSPVTRQYLAQLQEPLLLRGYFSRRTHPLLAPLIPQLRDLMKEYGVAGGSRVRVEFIDPQEDPELEEEAASRYGVKPVPFQVEGKYQAGVVNSYFHVVVAYGDQYEVLDYRNLIDVKASSETELEVVLRNPEYDITRAIRKVLTAYRGGGNPFETLERPILLHAYISPDEKLPERLRELRKGLDEILAGLKQKAGDKLRIEVVDPDANGGRVAAELATRFGLQPLVAGLLDDRRFWFDLILESGKETVHVPLPSELDQEGLERSLKAALKRFSPGFLKTVAVVTSGRMPYGGRFEQLRQYLEQSYRLHETDLADGRVPPEADLLLLLAPEKLKERERFAVDQFLMRGGTVILASSPFTVDLRTGLTAREVVSGLEGWLEHNGLKVGKKLVMDRHNATLPIPVDRDIGGITVREIHNLPYPFFLDLRGDRLNQANLITSSLGQLTMTWASPVTVDEKKVSGLRRIELLRSSPESWASDRINLVPDYKAHPDLGFPEGKEQGSQLVGVLLEGRFTSWFRGRPSPLLKAAEKPAQGGDGKAPPEDDTVASVIERSPDAARIILFASNDFASDDALRLATEGLGTYYTKPLELLGNAIDWSLEDRGLLALRSRDRFARLLSPLDRRQQLFWEYLNYALAAAALFLVWLLQRRGRRLQLERYRRMLQLEGQPS